MTNTNPHSKLPVLNWHNQNPNITTVEMLIVLYSDIVVKCERVNLVICDSIEYVIVPEACYTFRPIKGKLIFHYDYGFLISLHMSHVTFILHDQANHL
jgi:hypothetical protein